MNKFVKLTDVVEIISGTRHFPDTPSGKPTKFLRITDLKNNLINPIEIKSIKVASKSYMSLDKQKKLRRMILFFQFKEKLVLKPLLARI